MNLQATLTALLLCAGIGAVQASDEKVGVREISVSSPERGENFSAWIWYPAANGGGLVRVGDDRIFAGTPAWQNAKPAQGQFPLIVMSHGSGATVQKMGWLAADLAASGYIVAGPNHPGTMSGDSTPEDTPKLWERTNDLSLLVSAVSSDPALGGHMSISQVGALGYSLGGAAVMKLAGANVRLEAYARYCDDHPTMPDCVWFAGGRGYRDQQEISVAPFDLRTMDRQRYEQLELVDWVKAAVLVDPSMAQAFERESLSEVTIPLHFINLGRPTDVPVAVASHQLAESVPSGSISYIADASHFSFLPECQDGARAFMASIGEPDALCTDPGVKARGEIHREIALKVKAAFANAF